MRIARILYRNHETFMIINEEGKSITRDEIVRQLGLAVPSDLEEFLFGEYLHKIKDHRHAPQVARQCLCLHIVGNI